MRAGSRAGRSLIGCLVLRALAKGADLVAVRIADIGVAYVAVLFARAGGAFIRTAALHADCVKQFKGLHGRGGKGSVADRGEILR